MEHKALQEIPVMLFVCNAIVWLLIYYKRLGQAVVSQPCLGCELQACPVSWFWNQWLQEGSWNGHLQLQPCTVWHALTTRLTDVLAARVLLLICIQHT